MLSPLQQRKLEHLFHVYDVNRNGVVQVGDFLLVVSRIAAQRGWTNEHPRYQELLSRYLRQWQALAAGSEPQGSGQIPLPSWLALWNAILEASFGGRVAELCEVLFEAMDAQGQQRFTIAESRRWYEAYGLDPAQADETFPICDLNGDGYLSKEEWLVLVEEFFYSSDPKSPGNLLFGRLEQTEG